MSAQSFGCDFGTSSIKIYSKESDTIYSEKNMVAIEEKKGMIAYGDEAFDMHEKAPANIDVFYPMSFGTVASITYMQEFLRAFLESHTKGNLKGAEFVIALPTDVQDRVFTTLIQGTGLKSKNVALIDKPVAAGLGLGLDVTQAQGVMLVDVGADTTEISILSLGGTVTSKLIKVGGNKIDEAIANAIRREYGYFIGNKTAEILKNELGYQPGNTTDSREICGRNMALGLPAMLEITADFVANAISEQLKSIVDAIKMILERTPPELGVDIIRNGIFLTGGVANLTGLDDLIAKATNIRVNQVERPEECVARGLARVIKEKEFRSLTFATKEQAYN
ncbi:rod shape-determining protein [Anaerosacchariphilus sp. NSJ-68]|uniref:Cell shape-determining protein MreB n=2 Tax=Lachnospiraceae TaxID=186803 RepID=A0A923LCX8_9FIRM|nr:MULTISPECIES: rod shape-determining protein [Lachnospiraceae]MBC5660214.1 rod shape-determining protein [Anaerosacchariphilus hominis]MBC5699329.1 rod shape-determining protein [Roseburia difficilis]